MKYISHLDLLRLFHRASRRACIPVILTKGFNPHFKISVLRALKVGLESCGEEAVFCLEKDMGTGVFTENMNKELPEGVRIINAEIV